MDSRNKQELHQLFFDLREKYVQTFVIVTHDEELARITDRTIHIVDGQIMDDSAAVEEGDAAQETTEQELHQTTATEQNECEQ